MTGAPEIPPPPEENISPVRRGHRLGRYVLCYELASGGMATVYLGRATGLGGFDKLVALKVIHPHLAKDEGFVEMFLDEARIAARINHPNVCGVFDFGKEADTHFLAMEYLEGETCSRLARAIARRPEVLERFNAPLLMAFVVQQACEGLHAAHELKGDDGEPLEVVHRDMTPHNLFLGYDGSVRVVDFGVASAVGRMHETNTGTLKGKFAYMAPEQVRRETLDRRCDIWALGVSLWELLTGRRLFRREGEYETLQAVMDGAIPAPSAVRPGLPVAFDAIVRRALSRDLSGRYATAREMGRDLARAIGREGGASTADLADLMEELFAPEREKSAELVELARGLDPEEQSSSKVVVAPTIQTKETISASMPDSAYPTRAAPAPARRRWGWMLAAGLAVVLGGLATVWALSALDAGQEVAVGAPAAEPTDAPEPESTPDLAPGEVEREAAGDEEPPVAEEADPEGDRGAEANADTESPAESESPPESEAEAEPDEPTAPPRRRRRAERRPPEEPAPVGNGRVNVVTPPGWAEIFVGGRRVGRTPTEIRLPAGRQRIRLMPYGEGPAIVRTVTVENGGTSRLVVRLE